MLRGISLQASTHLGEHGERPAVALLRPALQAIEDVGPSPDVAYAQAELARALMLQSTPESLAESVAWCDRVLSVPDAAGDEKLLEVMVTKGTVMIPLTRLREAEVLLRGAIDVADRSGLIGTGVRARNNLLSLLELDDLESTLKLLEEGYAISIRYGLTTWALQFSHVALKTSFLFGEWDSWVRETAELEASRFYRGWRTDELGHRAAFRGDLDEARRLGAEAAELVGTASSQAAAGIGVSKATLGVAACDWPAVLPAARIGWSHYDATILAVMWALTAGIAIADPATIDEARGHLETEKWPGRLPDALRSYADVGPVLIQMRWSEARAQYLVAAHALAEVGEWLCRALLDLAVGTFAAGRFAEADEAAAAAEEFFTQRGAQSFVDRYRASIGGPRTTQPLSNPRDAAASSAARSRD